MYEKKNGMMFVLSSPSGVGKTTLTKKIAEKNKNFIISISHTTRKPRPKEINGKDYHFIDKQKFDFLIKNNSFFEYAKIFDNYGYKRQIRRRHSSGSYNTIYGNGIVPVLPMLPKRNSSVDRYNHLERTNSFIPTSPTNDNTINIYSTLSHPEDQNLDIAHITSRRITKRNNNNLRT